MLIWQAYRFCQCCSAQALNSSRLCWHHQSCEHWWHFWISKSSLSTVASQCQAEKRSSSLAGDQAVYSAARRDFWACIACMCWLCYCFTGHKPMDTSSSPHSASVTLIQFHTAAADLCCMALTHVIPPHSVPPSSNVQLYYNNTARWDCFEIVDC